MVTNSLPPPLFFTWKIWRPTSLRRAVCEHKNHSKPIFRHSIHLYIPFSEDDGWCGKICKWKRLPKLNNKVSFKICSGTIKSFPNHFDQFAFCVYIYIRLVDRIWMHSNISYFFWDNKFDIVCLKILLSANSQGITIMLKLFQN